MTDRSRHVPRRTCIGCGLKRPQTELVRLAAGERAGTIVLDRRRRLPGRGAYLCPRTQCLAEALRRRRVDRALRVRLTEDQRRELESDWDSNFANYLETIDR